MKQTSKIAVISGIVAIIIISAALTVHFRLSETEKSEITSGAVKNEKESASQIANEIVNSLQNKSEPNENTEQTANMSNTTNQIEMSVKEINDVYRWSNSNEINPAITLAANVDNVIQFTNPTDTKHAFIIKEGSLADFDIGPDSSGKLTIKPPKTGVFEYHCEYHPDTTNGTIIIK